MSLTRIAVAGATGRVGRHVITVLTERGLEPVPIARSLGVDVTTGAGLDQAIAGTRAVIDVTTTPSPDEAESVSFFTNSVRHLQAASSAAGSPRIVALSIIGLEYFPHGYGLAKQTQERLLIDGPVPATILRSAQFHEFVPQLLQWGDRGDHIEVTDQLSQLVSARTVAEVLVDLALTPQDTTGQPYEEVAGPIAEDLVAAATRYARRHGIQTPLIGVPDPADPAGRFKQGALLPGPGAHVAGPSFDQWDTGLLT